MRCQSEKDIIKSYLSGWWKGKQVWILYELVTVFCELWILHATGRPGRLILERLSNKPGYLPFTVQEHICSGHEELAVQNRKADICPTAGEMVFFVMKILEAPRWKTKGLLSIYAGNEPKSVLARDLGDCRDNLRNSRSVFLIVWNVKRPRYWLLQRYQQMGGKQKWKRNL